MYSPKELYFAEAISVSIFDMVITVNHIQIPQSGRRSKELGDLEVSKEVTE